jgi:hypothetical protein
LQRGIKENVDRSEVARKILRSLCANTAEEEASAIENFRNTKLDTLSFQGPEELFLNKLHYYYRNFGGPPSTDTLIHEADTQKETAFKMYIGEVSTENQSWGANYGVLLDNFVEIRTSERLSEKLVEISQIQKEGKLLDPKSKKSIKGSNSAIDYAIEELTKLRRDTDPHQKPLTKPQAIHKLRQQYSERMNNPLLSYGLGTGLSPIDEATKGAQNKELWMVAGFTGHGKTTWLLNWMRYLAYEGDFNILYYSLEMDRSQVWRILACGHACHPKFNRPLDYEKIKSG